MLPPRAKEMGWEVYNRLEPALEGADIVMMLRIQQERLGAQLFGALGLLALMVAAVGLYGVVSFDTRQRTHELGIRIALGASSRTLVQTALRSVVRVTTIGIAVGMVGALLGGRFVSALVYGVSPRDTTSMVAAGVTLLVVAVLACLAPAIRSTRVDPVIAMRAD